MLLQTSPKGSYRVEHLFEYFDKLLPVAEQPEDLHPGVICDFKSLEEGCFGGNLESRELKPKNMFFSKSKKKPSLRSGDAKKKSLNIGL